MMTDNSTSDSFQPYAKPQTEIDRKYDMNIPLPADAQNEEVALQQLREKLDATPPEVKSSLVYAQQVSPDLINDDHLLGFLYVEKFNIDLALKRLLRYWTNRHALFGDKYTQPLTLHGAMSDRIEYIRRGFLVLLPVLDEKGRAIIHGNFDPDLMGEELVDEVVQVWWYLIHVAMENPSVRKNGFILLANAKGVRLRDFHPRRALALIKATNNIPLTVQHCHLCNLAVLPLISPALKAMLPTRLRQTLTIHTGKDKEVMESIKLDACCPIRSTSIPTSMGGTIDASLEAFIQARLFIEGQGHETVRQISPLGSISSDTSLMNMSDLTSSSSIPPQKTASNCAAKTEVRKIQHYKMHPGRKGDMRMNKAVLARQQDPKMSLLSALLSGGFIFPQLYTPGVKMSQVKDTEGVTIYQRKNQLNRRLREERNRRKTDRS